MKVLLFGGTIEGRKLAEAIAVHLRSEESKDKGIEYCHVCVATQYGASLLPHDERLIIHHDRMDEGEMEELIAGTGFDVCIDATHPYAVIVSENIKMACENRGIKLYRLLREEESGKLDSMMNGQRVTCFDNVHDAVDHLKNSKGNILTTTGSKELKEFTRIEDYGTRVYARVLPVSDVLKTCEELKFPAGNLYCMQGPFSTEMNIAMINASHAGYLVTKSSGSAGGFDEKYEAAMQTGAELVVIGRPKEIRDRVYSYEEILDIIGLKDVRGTRRAYVIGAGCGNIGQLTVDAKRAIEESECLIGAGRILDGLGVMSTSKKIFSGYRPDEISGFLADNMPETVALLYSGDIGFYSGASGIADVLKDYEIIRVPGISSATYFCDRLGIPWQDVRFLSCHGRPVDISKEVGEGAKLLILMGETEDAGRICTELCKLNFEKARVCIGERLSYPEEKITEGTAEELKCVTTDPLSVMLILC